MKFIKPKPNSLKTLKLLYVIFINSVPNVKTEYSVTVEWFFYYYYYYYYY